MAAFCLLYVVLCVLLMVDQISCNLLLTFFIVMMLNSLVSYQLMLHRCIHSV